MTDAHRKAHRWTIINVKERSTAHVSSAQRLRDTFRFRRYDGEYRWMKSVGTPRFAPDGAFLGHVGSTLAITTCTSRLIIGNRTIGENGPSRVSNCDTVGISPLWKKRRTNSCMALFKRR